MSGNPYIDPASTTHRNFARQVEYAPDAAAMTHKGRTLTYGELNERACVLAAAIEDAIGAADKVGQKPVALCIANPLDNDIAMMAVWMAGHFFSCIDVTFPPARVRTLLNAFRPDCIVADQEFAYAMPERSCQLPVIRLGSLAQSAAGLTVPDVLLDSESIAMVSYTSGSTGEPKGVVQTHVRMTMDSMIVDRFGVEPPAHCVRATTFPAMSYANLAQIANVLRRGGHGCHYDLNTMDLPDLANALRDDEVAQVLMPPIMIRRLFADLDPDFVFESMSNMNVAGEPLLVSDVALLHGHLPDGFALLNTYAASEVGGIAHSLYRFGESNQFEDALWLDTAACNQTVAIVNAEDELIQPGEIGEMLIQGQWMARGYWIDGRVQRLDANAGDAPAQVHRTGDLFRLRGDGRCRYVGRKDFAISIGGHLIHPAEIEAAIAECPGIQHVSVREQEHPRLGPVIVAYLVGAGLNVDAVRTIRSSLAMQLPVHLLPYEYVVLDDMPLTSGGKLDKNKLPIPLWEDQSGHITRAGDPANTDMERMLAQCWTTVVGASQVTRGSNFFELGGTSLTALKLVRELSELLSREVALPAVYAFPTLAEFAAYLDGRMPLKQVHGSTICVQAGSQEMPFFCVHGQVERLATKTRPERPVYRLTVLHGEAEPNVASLAEQARIHLTDLKTLYPEGPVIIGGYSYGAYVALEMARQLEENGDPPALVVLLDPLHLKRDEDPIETPLEHQQKVAAAIASAPMMSPPSVTLRRVKNRLARIRRQRRKNRRARQVNVRKPSVVALRSRNMQIFGRFAAAHKFRPVRSRVLLFVPDKSRRQIRRDVGHWASYCHGPFDVVKIASANLHFDVFDDAALAEIAAGIEGAVSDIERQAIPARLRA